MLEITNEDNMELMKRYPDGYFELAIVDPPYGIDAAETKSRSGWVERPSKDWDKSIPPPEYFKELFRVSKEQIIWGGNYFTDSLFQSMGWIVWDKGQREFSLADGELAWTSFERALRIYSLSRGYALSENNKEGGRIHPTQKPVDLYKWLLKNYANEGDKILDTHLGSGSIAIAAHYMGYDLVACELDKEYYDSAMERIINQTRQETLI